MLMRLRLDDWWQLSEICFDWSLRYPGHGVPASAFTNTELGQGSDVFEWGTQAFSKIACARPVYLNVSPLNVILGVANSAVQILGQSCQEQVWVAHWLPSCLWLFEVSLGAHAAACLFLQDLKSLHAAECVLAFVWLVFSCRGNGAAEECYCEQWSSFILCHAPSELARQQLRCGSPAGGA